MRDNNDIEANNPTQVVANKKNDRLYKMLFCFIGLQVSYVAWGVSQEYLMTTEYSFGKFKSSSFCVFANRFLALIVALVIVLSKKTFNRNQTMKEAPFHYYAPASISNTLSSWAQYEALKYLSFPSQVLSKSCKLIPVMLVGILVNRKSYPVQEYIEALLITIGVSVFTISQKAGENHPLNSLSQDNNTDAYFGAILLATYLACDSFTSQWQSRVYKTFGVDQYQMMLGANIWSMLFTFLTLIQSGEFFPSLGFILADSHAMFHMIILSITSATGQLFIFYTIKELGPVVFTIIMTTRQIFSLFLSCVMFGHALSYTGFLSALFVFAIVINRIYRKGSD